MRSLYFMLLLRVYVSDWVGAFTPSTANNSTEIKIVRYQRVPIQEYQGPWQVWQVSYSLQTVSTETPVSLRVYLKAIVEKFRFTSLSLIAHVSVTLPGHCCFKSCFIYLTSALFRNTLHHIAVILFLRTSGYHRALTNGFPFGTNTVNSYSSYLFKRQLFTRN